MPTTIATKETTDLVISLATLNLGYLTVAVAILGFAGILFYLFNVKPLRDDLKQQKAHLNSSTENLENKIEDALLKLQGVAESNQKALETLKGQITKDITQRTVSLEEKQEKFSKEMKSNLRLIESTVDLQQMITAWNMHYVWLGLNVKVEENVFSSLLESLGNAAEYKKKYGENSGIDPFINMILETISEFLEENTVAQDDKTQLTEALKQFSGHDDKKRLLLGKVQAI